MHGQNNEHTFSIAHWAIKRERRTDSKLEKKTYVHRGWESGDMVSFRALWRNQCTFSTVGYFLQQLCQRYIVQIKDLSSYHACFRHILKTREFKNLVIFGRWSSGHRQSCQRTVWQHRIDAFSFEWSDVEMMPSLQSTHCSSNDQKPMTKG